MLLGPQSGYIPQRFYPTRRGLLIRRAMSAKRPVCCRSVRRQQAASTRGMQGLGFLLCRDISARWGTDGTRRPRTRAFGLGLAHSTPLTLQCDRPCIGLHDFSCCVMPLMDVSTLRHMLGPHGSSQRSTDLSSWTRGAQRQPHPHHATGKRTLFFFSVEECQRVQHISGLSTL